MTYVGIQEENMEHFHGSAPPSAPCTYIFTCSHYPRVREVPGQLKKVLYVGVGTGWCRSWVSQHKTASLDGEKTTALQSWSSQTHLGQLCTRMRLCEYCLVCKVYLGVPRRCSLARRRSVRRLSWTLHQLQPSSPKTALDSQHDCY